MTAIPRKQNAPGYIDEMGRFRPIRSPQYIGSGASKRKATVRDKKKYSRAKAGDLGKARQERALEAPWDREYRLEQEAAAADAKERARIEKEIEADVYGETSGRMSSGKAQSLAQFIRGQGGINTAARARRGRKVYGDLENFTRKGSGTSGLVTTVKGKGKGLDTMWQLARQSGFDLVSSDDLLDRLDDEIRSGKMTYATHGSLTYNPASDGETFDSSPIPHVLVVDGKVIRPNENGTVKQKAAAFILSISGYENPYGELYGRLTPKKALTEAHSAAPLNGISNDVRTQIAVWQSHRLAFRKVKRKPAGKKNPIKVLLHKFHVGQKLAARSIGDHDIIYRGQVVSRTPKFVVLKIEGERDLKRCGVSRWENTEVVYPFGRYSMAPSFRAKDGDRVGNPAGARTGKKAAGRAKVNPTVTAAERAGLVKFFKTLGMDGMAADVKAGGDVVKALKQSVGFYKSQPKLQAKMRQLIAMLEAKRNPARKKNPLDLIGTFANLAVGISSAMHIDEAMKRRTRRPAAKRRGTTKAKTTARRNPARMSTVKAKGGNLYVLTIQRGDDEVGIYLHDGNANGFSKEVKTLAAARAYAKRTGRKLVENPKRNPGIAIGSIPGWYALTYRDGKTTKIDIYGPKGEYNTFRSRTAAIKWINQVSKKKNPPAAIGKKAAARSKANPANKKGITIGDSNIRLVGFGKDRNGNSTVRVKYPNSGVFSIQTNGNLPATHGLRSKSLKWLDSRDMRSIERELIEYIRAFGSAKQKSGLRVPNPRPSAKTPRAARKNLDEGQWSLERMKEAVGDATQVAAGSTFHRWAKEHSDTFRVTQTAAQKKQKVPKVTIWRKWKFQTPAAKRKNPAKANAAARVPARRTFEMFQGRPATTAKRLAVSRHAPARLDQLGDLIEVKLNSGKVLDFSKRNFKLCAAGGKLWIAGGKIAKPNPAAAANEINPIDSIDHVVYGTRKPHHGDHEYTHYIHRLGEESGHMPTLCVDREGFPIIRGGKYKIEARGIVN